MSIRLAHQLNAIVTNPGGKIDDYIWPRKRDCQLNVQEGTVFVQVGW
jgi:hypothetical protein